MSTNVSSKASGLALDQITTSIPKELANNIQISQVEQVFNWVVKNKNSANELISFLKDNGFKNINLDSKGTTVTAQSGMSENNTATADCSFTATISGTCNIDLTEDECPNYYEKCELGGSIQCAWSSMYYECQANGCSNGCNN